MKVRISKNELNECIGKAIARVISENADDDFIAQLLANPNSAAAKAAGGDMGGKVTKAKTGGKRGRPSKKDMETAQAQATVDMDNIGDDDIETSSDTDVEHDDEDHASSFDMEVSKMPTDYVLQHKDDSRALKSEYVRRVRMQKEWDEEHEKPVWGYVIDPETGVIEPDPRHSNIGTKGDASLYMGRSDNKDMGFKWGAGGED